MKPWKDKLENQGKEYKDIDFSTLRYVIYARKSTTSEDRQAHSIPDQVKLCKDLAKRNNLHVVKVYTESQSAKTAGRRKVFDGMIKELRQGKYDGIIAWHPDRLCRNMLEAGVIIDMLDSWEIVDLKFCQHPFENTASGKMMLGMLFVFSKQYSDALSERVKRGVQQDATRGISNGAPKWGYKRDAETKFYVPDENYGYIRDAWSMRVSGAPVKEIHKFLKKNKVSRTSPNGKRTDTFKSAESVRLFLKDPFYYGVLLQGNSEIHLAEHYDFKAMITEEDYIKAQAVGYKEVKKYNRENVKAGKVFLPLKGMVICDECKHPMAPGRHMPGDKSGRVLYFDCRNKNCKRAQKSIMAGEVFDQIYDIFDRMEFNSKAYKRYLAELDGITDEVVDEIRRGISSKQAVIKANKNEIDKEAQKIIAVNSDTVKELANKRINDLEIENQELEQECEELKAKIKNPDALRLEEKEFVNLMKTLGDKIRAADIIQKDELVRKVFVNLYLDNQKRLHYLLREPFDSVVSIKENQSGGGGWVRTNDQAVMSRLL